MTGRTKITTKGQIVIPERIRNLLRWRPGTRLSVETLPEGGIKLDTLGQGGEKQADPIARGFGFLETGDPLGDLETEHREEVRADERRRRRR